MTFIGAKLVVEQPKYVLPFYAEMDCVRDANGVEVAEVNLSSLDDDREMAKAIAEALNEKFGGKPAKSTVTADTYGAIDGVGRWLIVDDKSYYSYKSDVEESVLAPKELIDHPTIRYTGPREIDPAILEGVEGRE
mgnify:CR=1 FL=1